MDEKDFKEFVKELMDHDISTYLKRAIDKNLGTKIDQRKRTFKNMCPIR